MGAIGDDQATFDPRQWAGAASTPPTPPAPPSQSVGPRRFDAALIGLWAAPVAIGISGLAAAYAFRAPDAPPPVLDAAPSGEAAGNAQAAAPALSRRVLNLQNSGELRAALIANGLDAKQSAAAAAAAAGLLGSGGEIRAEMTIAGTGANAKLLRLALSFADSSGAVVEQRADGSFTGSKVAAQLSKTIFVRRGQMGDDDFYSSAVGAGVIDSLISDFANAFVYDFNFQTEVTAGDVFEAAFEQDLNAQNQSVGAPRLLYASMQTATKSKQLYRFQPPGEEAAWFDGNGRSIKKSFMRTPVEGARVSSKFGMRFHPVLHYTRLHGGTDFAAPIGTPIYAAAAGVIFKASPSGCAGNMLMIHHDNGWDTHYFHLSRYAEVAVVGNRVAQGTTIGYVGMTGGCVTGPHLHYEVVIDGQKVDPQSIPTEEGSALTGDALRAFIRERDRIDVARAHYTG